MVEMKLLVTILLLASACLGVLEPEKGVCEPEKKGSDIISHHSTNDHRATDEKPADDGHNSSCNTHHLGHCAFTLETSKISLYILPESTYFSLTSNFYFSSSLPNLFRPPIA